ncbi:nitroreductase family protein [Muricomes intestini]|uniref:nitroreductase family protein n=1 Tax=Muricomes intestini TaxID=1796634 RepID=UPI00104DAD23|nr:nitroreductase family protein [Muricomes intestini]
MKLLNVLLNRRSVRQYTGEKISVEKLEKILQAGLLSPSGRNLKPWEFVVVQEKETLMKLSHCREGAARMLENAGCAILVFADPEKTDVWTEDCSIAMSNMHLMADSLGLGSCWIQGRCRKAEDGRTTEEVCREILSAPDKYVLEAILSVGILKEHPAAHKLGDTEIGKVHYEKF